MILGSDTNEKAKNDLKDLFDGLAVFDTPKPVELISYLLELNKDDGIILDFFAGSGVTAHAVMQLNVFANHNNSFICVQIPEKVDEESDAFEAKLKTISEITIARSKLASEKIKKSFEGKIVTPEDQERLDQLGFKVFTLSKSSFPRVDFAPDLQKSDEENMQLLQKYIKEKEIQLDLSFNDAELLTEILLKQGFMLTYKLELQPQFTDNNVYWATDGEREAYITVDTSLADKTVDYFLTHTDKKFICIERALDTTKKFNLKKALDMKFFAF